jgi:uncharacterized repeat protein (TIGR03833 family)
MAILSSCVMLITMMNALKIHRGISNSMSSVQRTSIRPGLRVSIVLKADQRSGKLTEGIVKDILTSSSSHPHGIKVRLESGQVGRVKEIKA